MTAPLAPDAAKRLFDAVRQVKGAPMNIGDVMAINAALAPPPPPVPDRPDDRLTYRTALELIDHEAMVLEAYKDSKGIWTWGIGVTDKSGHRVERYRDNPQTVEHVLAVYIWLLRTRYMPDVLKAFDGLTLSETQFAAALSFHYNTGAILRAGWVDRFKAGDLDGARAAFMEWRKPPEIIARRQKECDLFFDGKWSHDQFVTLYPVSKPSYIPEWRGARKVDVSADLGRALAA